MKLFISIHPEYVEKIITGEKKYEFRKKIFKREVEEVIIYSTRPSKKIECSFEIEEIIQESPSFLWEHLHNDGGINEKDFFNYFGDAEIGYAIKIKNVKKFDEPIIIKNREKIVIPQSFRYLTDEEFELIKNF